MVKTKMTVSRDGTKNFYSLQQLFIIKNVQMCITSIISHHYQQKTTSVRLRQKTKSFQYDNQCSKFYKCYLINLNHIILITAGLHIGSKIVNGDRTLTCVL